LERKVKRNNDTSYVFIKENDKKKLGKEEIPEKIFEIERRVLVKKKG